MGDLDAISVKVEYLPKDIAESLFVRRAVVAKIGYSRYLFNNFSGVDSQEKINSLFEEYAKEFFGVLTNSAHVMDISPDLETLLNKEDVGFYFGSEFKPLSMSEFVNVRVVVPRRKQDKLTFSSLKSWAPEQYNICFDGAMYLCYSETDSVPLDTNIGQITRELLRDIFKDSKILKRVDGIAPTPIHPDIYFLFADRLSDIKIPENHIEIFTVKNKPFYDLVVILPDTNDIESVISQFFQDAHMAISLFYSQKYLSNQIDEKIHELRKLNRELSELLSKHFGLSPFRRLFSKVPSQIRKTLSEMHLVLQDISYLEGEIDSKTEFCLRALEDRIFIKDLSSYLQEKMEQVPTLDKTSQLTIMSFAAEETVNQALIQATLIAAFVGAIIGGVLTIVAQYLLK